MRLTVESSERSARDERIPRALRAFFAALAKVNRDGHASFRTGELRTILGRDGRLASAPDVSKAIALAKAMGLLGPESCARCLVVDHRAVSQGQGTTGCPVHRLEHVK